MLAAEGAGRLTGDGVRSASVEHAVCGDRLELDVRVRAGRILDLAWRGEGCPATMAVAAAGRVVCGHAVEDAGAALTRRIRDLGGLAAT